MATNVKKAKKIKSPKGPDALSQRRKIENRDLNEDKQDQITNSGVASGSAVNENKKSKVEIDKDKSLNTIEEEQDNEQLRKQGEEEFF